MGHCAELQTLYYNAEGPGTDQTGLRTQGFIRGEGEDLRVKGQWELSASGVEEGLPTGEPMR